MTINNNHEERTEILLHLSYVKPIKIQMKLREPTEELNWSNHNHQMESLPKQSTFINECLSLGYKHALVVNMFYHIFFFPFLICDLTGLLLW